MPNLKEITYFKQRKSHSFVNMYKISENKKFIESVLFLFLGQKSALVNQDIISNTLD